MNLVRKDTTLHIGGEITVANITPALYRDYCQQLAGIACLDFSKVSRADSSSLALLIAAKQHAQAPLKVVGLPETMRLLAGLYEVLIMAETP